MSHNAYAIVVPSSVTAHATVVPSSVRTDERLWRPLVFTFLSLFSQTYISALTLYYCGDFVVWLVPSSGTMKLNVGDQKSGIGLIILGGVWVGDGVSSSIISGAG